MTNHPNRRTGDAKRAAKMNTDIVASMIESMRGDKLVADADIVKAISTDHMVEVMPSIELFRLIFGKPGEQKRWLHEDKDSVSSRSFMAQTHAIGLSELLLGDDTHAAYIKKLGITKIVHEKTPPVLLALGQISALEKNGAGELFTARDFLGIYTPPELVAYVDLADLYPFIGAVAELNGWIEAEPPKEEKPDLLKDVITPSELPPAMPPPLPKSDDEPEMEIDAAATGDELTLDVDDLDDKPDEGDEDTKVLERDSVPAGGKKAKKKAQG
jgi:hypothetical protein